MLKHLDVTLKTRFNPTVPAEICFMGFGCGQHIPLLYKCVECDPLHSDMFRKQIKEHRRTRSTGGFLSDFWLHVSFGGLSFDWNSFVLELMRLRFALTRLCNNKNRTQQPLRTISLSLLKQKCNHPREKMTCRKFDYQIIDAIDRTGVMRWKYITKPEKHAGLMLFTVLVNKHLHHEHKGRSTHLTGSHYHTNAVWSTTGVLRWYMVLYWHHTAHKQHAFIYSKEC